MKRILWLLLYSTVAVAQSITIPSQTVVTPVTINGTTVQVSVVIPAQTVALPAQGGASLPSGMTYSTTAGLQVTGPITSTAGITATSLTMTSGPTVPTNCTNNLYLWQLVSGSLVPVCYTAPALTIPPITVSSTGPNQITLTP